MPDIIVHNDTPFDLPLWVLEDIKLEVAEYFSERVRSIRVQSDIPRHAFNYKTCEVRYAFFLHDYVAPEGDSPADAIDPNHNGLHRTHNPLILPSNRDEEPGEAEAMVEDEATFAPIDEEFDAIAHDDDADIVGLDSDFDERDSSGLVDIGDETDDD